MTTFLLIYTALDVLMSGTIVFFLVKRKLLRQLPFFFCYVLYSGVDVVARFLLLKYGGAVLYFFGYWYSEIGEIVLALLAVRECLLNVFRGFEAFKWFGWTIRISIWLSILYGVAKVFIQPVKADWLVAIVVSTELVFQYWVMAVTILFFLLCWFLRLASIGLEAWIVLGFLIEAVLIVTGVLLRSVFGTRFVVASSLIPSLAYLLGKGVWLSALVKRLESSLLAQGSGPGGPSRDEAMQRLSDYANALKKIVGRR